MTSSNEPAPKLKPTDLYFSINEEDKSVLLFVASKPEEPQPLVVRTQFPLCAGDLFYTALYIGTNDKQGLSQRFGLKIALAQFRFDAKDALANLAITGNPVYKVSNCTEADYTVTGLSYADIRYKGRDYSVVLPATYGEIMEIQTFDNKWYN